MLTTFNATLSPMLVMFLCIVIGFICKKFKIVPENTATVLSKLENYVLVPALITNTFMKYCTVSSIGEQYSLILYSLVALGAALAIALPLSKVFSPSDAYKRNIYKYALSFGNFSFMGNAIVPAILGEEALYPYMLYILPLNVAVYTWGLVILNPNSVGVKGAVKSLLNPIFAAIIVGMVLGLTGVTAYVPSFISKTITDLAACMGPLAMVLTGFVIGGYGIKKLLVDFKVYVATALRLIVLPILFVAVLWLLGADRTTLVMTLFAYATPLGLNTVVFPAAYGGDTTTGASMATISHTLCVVTIPLMYALFCLILPA